MDRRRLLNKKGAMGDLTESVIFVFILVIFATVVIASFNSRYSQSYNLGLDTSGLEEFNRYATSGDSQVREGEASLTSDGLSLTSSWALVKGLYLVLWSFFNGSFINVIIIDMLQIEGTAGATLALTLRALFLITLIFAIIKLFFKTKA
jgi:hypothetical protein